MENPVYEKLKDFEESEPVWAVTLLPIFYQHEEKGVLDELYSENPGIISARNFCAHFGSDLEARTLRQGVPVNFNFNIPRALVELTETRHAAACKWSLDKFTEAYNHPPRKITPHYLMSSFCANVRASFITVLSGFKVRATVTDDVDDYRRNLTQNYQIVRDRLDRSRPLVADVMFSNYTNYVENNIPDLLV